MAEITVPAKTSELDKVLEFINKQLREDDFPARVINMIDIAAEEIFQNIASYAYKGKKVKNPEVEVGVLLTESKAAVTFKDEGRQFNPLEKENPDVTLSSEDREIGGLGIFMVKESMDKVKYEYQDGKNILTILKSKDVLEPCKLI